MTALHLANHHNLLVSSYASRTRVWWTHIREHLRYGLSHPEPWWKAANRRMAAERKARGESHE